MGHEALVLLCLGHLNGMSLMSFIVLKLAVEGLTREDEQAVSMLTEGPFKPRVNEMRPQTTERVPDVAV